MWRREFATPRYTPPGEIGPSSSPLPFIPGHEGVGEVLKLGPGEHDVKVGDMVGNAWLW